MNSEAGCHVASLPPELDSLVALSLRDDPVALRAYCLTSRSWLAAGRPVLFRKVKLHYQRHLQRLSDALIYSPELGRYIRNLRVSDRVVLTEEFASYLVTLQEIQFYVSIHTAWNVENHTALAKLSSVTTICFQWYHIQWSHIAEVLCQFPMLEQLELIMCSVFQNVDADSEASAPTSLPPRSPNLRLENLRILGDYPTDGRFFGWLRGLKSLCSVSLQLNHAVAYHIPVFLRSLGPSLKALELCFAEHMVVEEDKECLGHLKKLDFSTNTSLHTLQFYRAYDLELHTVLTTVPPQQIHTLSFHIGFQFPWHMMDHERLASALCSPQFAGLQKLRFIHEGWPLRQWECGDYIIESRDTLIDGGNNVELDAETIEEGEFRETLKSGEEEADPYHDIDLERHCQVEHADNEDKLPGVDWLWTNDVDLYDDDSEDELRLRGSEP